MKSWRRGLEPKISAEFVTGAGSNPAYNTHNQSVSNRTSGIEFRYGGDGYAANSKFRYTGPVGFPN